MAKSHKPTKQKRHGNHHRKSKKYHAAYWPYIPVLVLLASMFLFSAIRSPVKTDVLAFATEMSSAALLEETNRQRINRDREPLELNEKLSAAARAKAEDMARNDYWSHVSPDGQEPWQFIEEANYSYIKAGENLAYGFLSSRQTVNGWMNSDSHRDNMLDRDFSEVGFGYVNAVNYQGLSEETIIVALYAEPLEASKTNSASEETFATPQNNADTVISMTVPEQNDQGIKAVTRIQSLAGGQFAWMTFSLGIVSGTAAAGLLASHGVRLRRLLKKGEDFVLHHPLLDICLVTLLLLTAFLADHVGYIM